MSIPLLLSLQMKKDAIPHGEIFMTLFVWLTLSYWVVPLLIALECVTLGWLVIRGTRRGTGRIEMLWHICGIGLGVVGEIVLHVAKLTATS